MADVFEHLATELEKLPEEMQEAYKEAVVEEVDKSAEKLNTYFMANSGSTTLNSHRVVGSRWIGTTYFAQVDWDDKTPVNELKGKKSRPETVRRNAKITRRRGKRNFSIRPATTHDLAYIINYGVRNADGSIKRVGTYFINKGFRRIKNLDKNIEKNFDEKLILLGKRFE